MTAKLSEYQQACSQRDKAARTEQALEDRIFSLKRDWTTHEMASVLRDYRIAKDNRARVSIRAAELFMQLSPSDRELATSEWLVSSEGKRKSEGSGIRGRD